MAGPAQAHYSQSARPSVSIFGGWTHNEARVDESGDQQLAQGARQGRHEEEQAHDDGLEVGGGAGVRLSSERESAQSVDGENRTVGLW